MRHPDEGFVARYRHAAIFSSLKSAIADLGRILRSAPAIWLREAFGAWWERVVAGIVLVVGCWLLAGWAGDHAELVSNANDAVTQLVSVGFTVQPNTVLIIGAQELGQTTLKRGEGATADALSRLQPFPKMASLPQQPVSGQTADTQHVAFFLHGGKLYISNVSKTKALAAHLADGETLNTDRWLLSRVVSVSLGRTHLTVDKADTTGLAFTITEPGGTTRHYAYDPVRETLALGPAVPHWAACPSSMWHWPKVLLSRLARSTEQTLIRIGGNWSCLDGGRLASNSYTLAVPQWQWRTLIISQTHPGEYWLRTGLGAEQSGVALSLASREDGIAGHSNDFRDTNWQVNAAGGMAVSEIIVGRTDYSIAVSIGSGGTALVKLTPLRDIVLLPRGAPVGDGLYQPRPWFSSASNAPNHWRLEFAIVLLVAFFSIVLSIVLTIRDEHMPVSLSGYARIVSHFFRQRVRMWSLLTASIVLAGCSVAPLSVPWMPASLIEVIGQQSIWPVVLNWMLMGAVLFAVFRSALAQFYWLAVVMLVSTGALSMVALTTAYGTTRLTDNFLSHRFLVLDLIPVITVAVALTPARLWRWPGAFADLALRAPGSGNFLRSLRSWRGAFAIVLAVLLCLAMIVGSESGTSGFQPGEIGKFAIALFVALLGAIYDEKILAAGSRGVMAATFVVALLLGVVFVISPGLRSDFSPVLILSFTFFLTALAVWTMAMISEVQRSARSLVAAASTPVRFGHRLSWRWALEHARWKFLAGYVAGAVILVGVAFFFQPLISVVLTGQANSSISLHDGLKSAMYQNSWLQKIRERFLLWTDAGMAADDAAPVLSFGNLDDQLIRSRVIIGHGACARASQMSRALSQRPDGLIATADRFGNIFLGSDRQRDPWAADCPREDELSTDPAASAPAERRSALDYAGDTAVPVVATDFMPAFMLGRFGVRYAFFVFAGQLLFILASLSISIHIWFAPLNGSGIRERAACRVMATLVAATSIVFLSQWLLSWCNVLGILPIMGQPMTWMSFATSHHLFLAVPAVGSTFVALRYWQTMRAPPRWFSPPP
jgi:hypothetical protein